MTPHPWQAINGYDRLPIAVLETYIKPGCGWCVVCNEAKAQIAQRRKEAQA